MSASPSSSSTTTFRDFQGCLRFPFTELLSSGRKGSSVLFTDDEDGGLWRAKEYEYDFFSVGCVCQKTFQNKLENWIMSGISTC